VIAPHFDGVPYGRRRGSQLSERSCAHGSEEHVTLDGTWVRHRLYAGFYLPAKFTRPQVAAVAADVLRATKEGAHG
jgi:sulfate adenylyltransferase